jgi:hypothetical protein
MKIIEDNDEYIALSEVEYGNVFKFGEKFYVKVDISAFTDSRIQYNGSFALSLDNFSIVRFVKDDKAKAIIYEPQEMHLVRKG